MTRLVPRSLVGQIALVIAVVLLVVQAIGLLIIHGERQRLNQTLLEGPVITRFLARGTEAFTRGRAGPIRTRRGRIMLAERSTVAPGSNVPRIAARLRETAAANGLALRDARAALSDTLPPPPPGRNGRIRDPEAIEKRAERFRTLLLSVQLPDGRWINGQMLVPRPSGWPLLRLGIGTVLLYLLLLGAVALVLRRLIQPLRDLTDAARRYRGLGEHPRVEPRGPADIRRAILAFNAMGGRVGSLLDEKDRMLGAIGHDLRTPLASLRIRAENVEPPEERDRIIAKIEEMTQMLDDTLALARSGRSAEPPRRIDVSALADAVVEEFGELGHDVAMEESERAVACLRPTVVRGAIRNLVENGVKHAGAVLVSVAREGERVTVSVADRGPGIPEAELTAVQEPFVRLERSRSRETGGSGLGLALARAAAEVHGGTLELTNRIGGGLDARLVLPVDERGA